MKRFVGLVMALYIGGCTNPLGSLSTDSSHFPEGDSTLTVTDGLIARFSPSDITGASQGDRVSSVTDLSGNGNDATQSTTNEQPKYQDASNGINGQPALLFGDGNELTNIATPSVTVTNRTVFAVLQILGAPPFTTGPVFLQKDGVGTNDYGVDGRTTFTVNNPPATATNGTASYSGTVIVAMVVDTNATTLFIDGTQDAQDVVAAGQTVGAVIFGGDAGGNVTNGKFGEMLVYNRALSTAERESVESYLNSLYAAF